MIQRKLRLNILDALMALDWKISHFIDDDTFSLIQSYEFSKFLCFPVKMEMLRHSYTSYQLAEGKFMVKLSLTFSL